MAISFQCEHCQRQFKAKEANAGKRTKCPQCGHPLIIPGEVAEQAPEAAPAKKLAPDRQCPSCRSRLSSEAVVCVQCGLDLRTGQLLAPPSKPVGGPDEPTERDSEVSPVEREAMHHSDARIMSWARMAGGCGLVAAALLLHFLCCDWTTSKRESSKIFGYLHAGAMFRGQAVRNSRPWGPDDPPRDTAQDVRVLLLVDSGRETTYEYDWDGGVVVVHTYEYAVGWAAFLGIAVPFLMTSAGAFLLPDPRQGGSGS